MQLKNVQLKVKVGLKFEITFSTQHLGLSIFYPFGANMDKPKCWVKNSIEK